MSASRRTKLGVIVEALYRCGMSYPRLRLYVDEHARTGLRCPACKGKGSHAPDPNDPVQFGAYDCDLCGTRGALRPRGFGDRDRMDDQARLVTGEDIYCSCKGTGELVVSRDLVTGVSSLVPCPCGRRKIA